MKHLIRNLRRKRALRKRARHRSKVYALIQAAEHQALTAQHECETHLRPPQNVVTATYYHHLFLNYRKYQRDLYKHLNELPKP